MCWQELIFLEKSSAIKVESVLIYVILPFSNNFWAIESVCFTENPNSLWAAICNVVVIKGGGGFTLSFLFIVFLIIL